MKKFRLSNSEDILLNALWKENAPLTVAQLSEKITEARWNGNYVDKLLKQLAQKGMVKVGGIVRKGQYQSRQFVPCYTKDEFLANILEENGVDNVSLARVALALFKKSSKENVAEQNKELIAELEKMVDQYEAGLEEKNQ